MPHLVPNILRTPSGTIVPLPKRTRNNARNHNNTTTSSSSRNPTPYSSPPHSGSTSPNSSTPSLAVKMPDLADAIRKSKKGILPNPLHFGRASSRDRDQHSKKSKSRRGPSGIDLDWSLESPPVVFHGTANDSTGALVSGQMFLHVREPSVEMESFKAWLKIHTTQKRPHQGHCTECANQYKEVASWVLIQGPATLNQGRHSFPFSVLLSGDLPASMETTVTSIEWEFTAEATLAAPVDPADSSSSGSHSQSNLTARFLRSIPVKRSVPEPEMPHQSIRVFPPTNLKATSHYSSVIHPSGTNNVRFCLDGLVTHHDKVKTIDLWKIKKVTWKLEETVKTTAPACERHAATAPTPADPSQRKGTPRSEVRLLGEGNFFEGWKSDYENHDGHVEIEFDYGINQFKPNSRKLKFACDSSHHSSSGRDVSVTHSLIIEIVVSKEFAPEEKPQLSQPTGTGRVLRMHYSVVVTEHPGMGVSWDNETPPMYMDVPPSPPCYQILRTPDEEPVEYATLEMLDARRASVEPLDLTIERTNE